MRRGDVVILSQSYSDGSASKVRPVLVVSSDRDNARLVNVIVATITRNISRVAEPTHLLIDLATPAGKQSGLNGTSAVVCNNLFTVERRSIRKTIGSLPPATMARIDDCLKAALGLP